MLISPSYLALQTELHRNPGYGVASRHYAKQVADMMNALKSRSLSDYGAGKCRLRDALHMMGKKDFDYRPYDPAFPEYGPAREADFVACIDVLEHIEPECLDAVLDDLQRITVFAGLLTVATRAASKSLPDGRNAHLIQEPETWWMPKLLHRFKVVKTQPSLDGFMVGILRKP